MGVLPWQYAVGLAGSSWDLLKDAITLRSLALLLVRLGTPRVVTRSHDRRGEAWTRPGQVKVPVNGFLLPNL